MPPAGRSGGRPRRDDESGSPRSSAPRDLPEGLAQLLGRAARALGEDDRAAGGDERPARRAAEGGPEVLGPAALGADARGSRNGWCGISARRPAMRSGTVAPDDGAEGRQARAVDARRRPTRPPRRATSSCQRPPVARAAGPAGRRRPGLEVRTRAKRPRPPAVRRLDERRDGVAAERRVDGERVDRRRAGRPRRRPGW